MSSTKAGDDAPGDIVRDAETLYKKSGFIGRAIKPGQFVIGSSFAWDNTGPHCRAGYQASCERKAPVLGAQAPRSRVPLADGTLVATRDKPSDDVIPSLLALSDVMGAPSWRPAPVRKYLPELIGLVFNGTINPGKVFDLVLPLSQVRKATVRWTSAARSKPCASMTRTLSLTWP
jgi:hypothetical protein